MIPSENSATGTTVRDTVATHVTAIDRATSEDVDALLTELLVHVYPTTAIQDA